ncbi:MAG TPA: type II secretion system protein N [Ramlibacter sp.]|nr:type II secretion system protein N [Ramlibacter sp.]
MVSNMQGKWVVAASTFAVWALVAASAVYWGLKLASRPAAAPGAAVVRAPVPADPAAVARLLGSSPAVATAGPVMSVASRFSLQGVVASRTHDGAALIAVDGKPPKPYRVGAPVDENLVLKSVDSRHAVLASSMSGPPVVTLELPLRK